MAIKPFSACPKLQHCYAATGTACRPTERSNKLAAFVRGLPCLPNSGLVGSRCIGLVHHGVASAAKG